MVKSIFTLLLILFLFISCKKDEGPTPFIDPEFETIVDSFVNEAEKRGKSLSVDLLTVVFGELAEGICGVGSPDRYGVGRPGVVIKSGDGCWESATDDEKENFLFHELGHALLGRTHLQNQFANGSPASIMCSRLDGYLACNIWQVYYQAPEMRDYFLDELFGLVPSTPEWASGENQFNRVLLDGEISANADSWETVSRRTNDEVFFSYSFEPSPSNSLVITQTGPLPEVDRADQPVGIWFKMFDVSDIPDCSSIKATARVNVPESFDGLLELGLSLREEFSNGEVERFALHFITEENLVRIDEDHARMDLEIYCVPERTDIVTISLIFNSSTLTVVTFDDIEVTLWD